MKYKWLLLAVAVLVIAGGFYMKGKEGGNNIEIAGCFVGGCSGQICSEEPGAVSTCEFRAEYACYRTAKCERQVSGKCGWTPSESLSACLAGNSKM